MEYSQKDNSMTENTVIDTAFLEAVAQRDFVGMDLLLKAGANPNAPWDIRLIIDPNPLSYGTLVFQALGYAFYKQDYELASFLAKNGAKLNGDCANMIRSHLRFDKNPAEFKKWMELLIDCGYLNYSPFETSKSLVGFIYAYPLNNDKRKENFETLLKLGVGKNQHWLLLIMARNGWYSVLPTMMQNGFDVTKTSVADVSDKFVRAQVNTYYGDELKEPFLQALYYNKNEKNREERNRVFQEIVRTTDVDVNQQESVRGNTILHRLVELGEAEQVKFLLENTTVDIDIKNNAGQTALDIAIENNQADCMKVLLPTGLKRTKVLSQLLFNVVSHSAVDCAKVLLDMGIDVLYDFVQYFPKKIDSLFLLAVSIRNFTAMKMLLAIGANPNVFWEEKSKRNIDAVVGDVLGYAFDKQDYELASFLAKNGAKLSRGGASFICHNLLLDKNPAEFKKMMELMIDCGYLNHASFLYANSLVQLARFSWNNNKKENFETLIKLGVGKNQHWLLPLIARSGKYSVLPTMMQNGFDVTKTSVADVSDKFVRAQVNTYYGDELKEPFLQALYYNKNEKNREERNRVFQEIVRTTDVDVNQQESVRGNTILHRLVELGETEQVRFLIDNTNIDIDTKNQVDQTALDVAVEKNNADCMKILLSTGVKRTAILNQLLFDAVSHSAVDCAKVLLDMGADANSQFGEEKLTPLMHAKTVEMAELLLDNDANACDIDRNRISVLHHLIRENAPKEIINMVLDCGANPNAITENGKTVLMSLPAGREDILSMLLAQPQVALNARDNNGNTALMHYTKENNLPYVRMLCLAKADLMERNNDGKTALMIASESGNQAMQLELYQFISAKYLPTETPVTIVRNQPQVITLAQRDNVVNSIGN